MSLTAPEAAPLTAAEASAFLRVHINTLHRLAAAGEIPGRRVGARWRFLRTELERWLTGDYADTHAVPRRSRR